MQRSKRIIGLFLIVLSILGIFSWEKWGKERLFYDEVLVLKENVQKGEVITEEMLTVKRMEIDEKYISFQGKEAVLGKQAAGFIHKGVPLFNEYFEERNLSPDIRKGYYGMTIPAEWISTKPMTLSKGDKVFFFYGDKMITSAYVSAVGEEGCIEVIVNEYQAAVLCGITTKGHRLALIYQ